MTIIVFLHTILSELHNSPHHSQNHGPSYPYPILFLKVGILRKDNPKQEAETRAMGLQILFQFYQLDKQCFSLWEE